MKMPSYPRLLAVYSGLLTVAFVAMMLMGAVQLHKVKLEEIDVQRINIVEPDGTVRMIISNTARAPGIILRGKEYPHPNRKSAGLLFYNDEGTENGGLIFDGARSKDGKVSSHGHLSFDGYEQDQTMVIEADQDATDDKSSYMAVYDQPAYSLQELMALLDRNRSLPRDEQQAAIKQFFKDHPQSASRLVLGRLPDHSSQLALKDAQGRNRIVIKVAADGTPALQFIDADGKIIDQLPPIQR